jgi:hypothetical protein
MDIDLAERSEIASCSDALLLAVWHADAYDLHDDIVARIEMHRLAGSEKRDWLHRAATKGAHAKVAMKRIERRMLELGLEPPLTRNGHERNIIRQLKDEIRALKQEIKDLRVEAEGPEPVEAVA